MKVHYSSKSNEWETPQKLFNKLNKEFAFTLDPCATRANTKCGSFYTKAQDGLSQDWANYSVFMNPPYGKEIGKWMQKAESTAKTNPCPVVCLVPARTDTTWWHDYCMKADEIRFIRGRLKFGDQVNSAPFPSALIIFYPAMQPRLDSHLPKCISWKQS